MSTLVDKFVSRMTRQDWDTLDDTDLINEATCPTSSTPKSSPRNCDSRSTRSTTGGPRDRPQGHQVGKRVLYRSTDVETWLDRKAAEDPMADRPQHPRRQAG